MQQIQNYLSNANRLLQTGNAAHSVQPGHQTRRASGHLLGDIFCKTILA